MTERMVIYCVFEKVNHVYWLFYCVDFCLFGKKIQGMVKERRQLEIEDHGLNRSIEMLFDGCMPPQLTTSCVCPKWPKSHFYAARVYR